MCPPEMLGLRVWFTDKVSRSAASLPRVTKVQAPKPLTTIVREGTIVGQSHDRSCWLVQVGGVRHRVPKGRAKPGPGPV